MVIKVGQYKTKEEIPQFKIEVNGDDVYLSFVDYVIDRASTVKHISTPYPTEQLIDDVRVLDIINKPYDPVYRRVKIKQKEVKRLIKRYYNKNK